VGDALALGVGERTGVVIGVDLDVGFSVGGAMVGNPGIGDGCR
jgi:hypothetical protein